MEEFEISYRTLKSIDSPIRSVENGASIIKDLQIKGYSVVRVMPDEHAQKLLGEFREWLCGLDPNLSLDDPSEKSWPDNILGIIKSYGIGQARFMWEARLNLNINRLFSLLWGCEQSELITSFDGACYCHRAFAPATGNFKLWPHCDQQPSKHTQLQCYQGSLSLTANHNKHDGGFVVWPKSHMQYIENNIDVKSDKRFFQVHTPTGKITANGARRVIAPPGTFIVWDSRTFHCNSPPLDKSRSSDRVVLYICMVPRSMATKETLDLRYRMYTNGSTTSHQPHDPHVNPDVVRYSTSLIDPRRIPRQRPFSSKNELFKTLVPIPCKK
jgi:hypothetical protein